MVSCSLAPSYRIGLDFLRARVAYNIGTLSKPLDRFRAGAVFGAGEGGPTPGGSWQTARRRPEIRGETGPPRSVRQANPPLLPQSTGGSSASDRRPLPRGLRARPWRRARGVEVRGTNGRRVAVFTIAGPGLDEAVRDYHRGQALVDLRLLKSEVRRLKDMAFEALRAEERRADAGHEGRDRADQGSERARARSSLNEGSSSRRRAASSSRRALSTRRRRRPSTSLRRRGSTTASAAAPRAT